MATITVSANHSTEYTGAGVNAWKWLLLTTTNSDGSPVNLNRMSDRCVTVSGTFGSGGTLVIEGSNDGTNYYTLNDLQGNALSFTSAKIEGISELPTYIRPRVTAGDGTTSLNVYMNCVGRP